MGARAAAALRDEADTRGECFLCQQELNYCASEKCISSCSLKSCQPGPKHMLTRLKKLILNFAIKNALKRPAPNTIPLSDLQKMRERNYYTIRLFCMSTNDRFIVKRMSNNGLEGYWFSEKDNGAGRDASIPHRSIPLFEVEIKHYARELEIIYNSYFKFLLALFTFKAKRDIWSYRFRVWAYSKKKLPRQDRLEVLAWAYEWNLAHGHPDFSPVSFLIHRHGQLIVLHPEFKQQMRYYRLVLDSLVASGDLEKLKSGQFSLSPKALATLDYYEEADRRHQDNLRQQRILGWLTFALVLVGATQIAASFFTE